MDLKSEKLVCEFCCEEFDPTSSNRFCSISCKGKYANSKSPSGSKSPNIEKQCEYCGIVFSVSKGKFNRKYCSIICSAKGRTGKDRKKSVKAIPKFDGYCANCKILISKNRKFCSKECRSDYITGFWTYKEDCILLSEFEDCNNLEELCLLLNKNKTEVNKRALYLGLKRSENSLIVSLGLGGKKNKGRKRPDFVKNTYRFWEIGEASPFKGKHHSDKSISILSAKAKLRWKDPSYAIKRMEGLKRNKKNGWECPNYYERELSFILQEIYPDKYKFVGDWTLIIDGKNPDFISDDKTKIIEVFGEVYHDPKASAWEIPEHRTEDGTRKFYDNHGYKTLIVWCKEFRNKNQLIEKIRSFHENRSN